MPEDSIFGRPSLSGVHPVNLAVPVFVAPTTGGEYNTLRPLLEPVACWRLNDVLFDFDSSFIRPEMRKEIHILTELVRDHPGALASIFGHADPSGKDNYNKKLSGERAAALYALLVRDTGTWERLCTNPAAGKPWGASAVQTMLAHTTDGAGAPFYAGPVSGMGDAATTKAVRDFQTAKGLKVDGNAGSHTRAALFLAYMDALCADDLGGTFRMTPEDFLGRGVDPDHKADYQGCSEFNPVIVLSKKDNPPGVSGAAKAERDRKNAPNRRVMLYLFRPGLVVEPGSWPCPAAKQGADACRAQFWPDGDARRLSGAKERRYKQTRDTFACRLYDAFSRRSPCEGVAPLGTHLVIVEWEDELTPELPADLAIRLIPAERPAVQIPWSAAEKAGAQRRFTFGRIPRETTCTLEAIHSGGVLRLWHEQIVDDPARPPVWEHTLRELINSKADTGAIQSTAPMGEEEDLSRDG